MQSHVWTDYEWRVGSPPPTSMHDAYEYLWPDMLVTLRGHARAGHTHAHLVVDEGQDLPAGFFTYGRRHLAQVLSVFADDDQAITRRRTTLEQIQTAAGLPNPVILSANHRNTQPIADLAERFHSGRLPPATVQRRVLSAELPRLIRTTGLDETCQYVMNWYVNRGGSVGVIVKSNETGSALQARLRSRLRGSVRIDCYTHSERNEDDINVLEDGITIVNTESVKGQEFDAVFLLELSEFIPCSDERMRRTMYMICTRARDHLFLVQGNRPLSAAALAQLPATLVERS